MSWQPNTIGIAPPGALGMGFFFHLTDGLKKLDGKVWLIGLDGSRSTAELRKSEICISADNQRVYLDGAGLIYESFSIAEMEDRIPEILLVCPNPDQLLGVVTSLVQLLEKQNSRQPLEPQSLAFPTIVLSSNGIYFQRIRQIFVEKLEESTLYGRLPDLWPDLMPEIVGRLLRGVTIQTGLREGAGAKTIYYPGKRGITKLGGGNQAIRERCAALLSETGGWFELSGESSPTRLEFDKGIINLVSNFLGLIHAFQADGSFVLLRVEEILVPENQSDIDDLGREVFAVGRSVKAYGPQENWQDVLANALTLSRRNNLHIPSSLQLIELRLRDGTLTEEFPPTEEWLIAPLIKYARSAGLKETEAYFQNLRERLIEKLRLGVAKMKAISSK